MTVSAGKTGDFVLQDPKTKVLAEILRERHGVPMRLLVVGCGSGTEAAVLAQHLHTQVTGIDINTGFHPVAAGVVDLRYGDATQMEFPDGSFDFVYSYHALEHIPDYRKALLEIRRILKEDGGYLIGTPNKSRLIGYVGSRNATPMQKLRWNIADWQARLRGEFRNELGAHAGYTETELRSELASVFGFVESITFDYYRRIYAARRSAIDILNDTGLGRWLFPAIYFYGVR